MIIIAVDPGADGAVTLLPIYSFRSVVVLPFKYNTLTDIFQHIQAEALQLPIEPHTSASQPYLSEVGERSKLVHPVKEQQGKRTGRPYLSEVPTTDISSTQIGKSDILTKQRNTQMELWLEDPAYIPKNGKFSLRKLGERIGEWKGIAAALNLTPQMVSPKTWQAGLSLKISGDKNKSKSFAQKAYPFLTRASKGGTTRNSTSNEDSAITLSTADSLLIALYAYTLYVPRNRMPHTLKALLPLTPNPTRKPARAPKSKKIRKVETNEMKPLKRILERRAREAMGELPNR